MRFTTNQFKDLIIQNGLRAYRIDGHLMDYENPDEFGSMHYYFETDVKCIDSTVADYVFLKKMVYVSNKEINFATLADLKARADKDLDKMKDDLLSQVVDHPAHYGGADNPFEVIKVIEAWGLDFALGNAIKYIARHDKKNKDKQIEDLEKAKWYLERKIIALQHFKNKK